MIDLLIEREGESELSEIRRPERIEVRREKGQEEQSSSGGGEGKGREINERNKWKGKRWKPCKK